MPRLVAALYPPGNTLQPGPDHDVNIGPDDIRDGCLPLSRRTSKFGGVKGRDADLLQRSRFPAGGLRQIISPAMSAMGVRSYKWWSFAQVLSASGNITQGVAQSWLVLKMTGSAFLLATLTTVMFAPCLLASPWAGSLADRYDRRKLLLVTQSIFVVLGASLGVIVLIGALRVWMIFAFALASGIVTSVDLPTRQVFVVDLVGRDRTPSAISLNEVVLNLSRVVGPALGGIILATVGAAACFLVNSGSFLPPLFIIAALFWRRGWQAQQGPGVTQRSGHVREGLAYAWRRPAIRSCILIAVAGGMLFNMASTLPLMASRVFHVGPGGYGAMMAAVGSGAVLGAAFASAGPPWPSGRRVRVLVLAAGVEVCLTAVAPTVGLLYAGLVAAGFLSIWFICLANALVQQRSEPALRGRMMGVWTMALPGSMPLTSLLVGAVATLGGRSMGAREAFGLGGAAMTLTAIAGWRALADKRSADRAPTSSGPESAFKTLPVG